MTGRRKGAIIIRPTATTIRVHARPDDLIPGYDGRTFGTMTKATAHAREMGERYGLRVMLTTRSARPASPIVTKRHM